MRSASREEALLKLAGKPPGTFVIRASPQSFAALSLVKNDGSQYHMHIEQSSAGVYLRKCKQVFPDLFMLVQHYSESTQQDLPTPLCS